MKMQFSPNKEIAFLNSLVENYKDQTPYSNIKKEIIVNLMKQYLENPEEKIALQMGCSNGYETKIIAEYLLRFDVIDGSAFFLEKLQNYTGFKNVNFINSLFEKYVLDDRQDKYDYIICNYVLEHVFEVKTVLKNIKNNLKEDGFLFITVPNQNALSRQIAFKMNSINSLNELTENDIRHGHRRTFDKTSIESELNNAGFKIVDSKGIILKILADFQLNKLLGTGEFTAKHIWALYQLGLSYENFCDSIFIVAKHKFHGGGIQ